MDGCGETSLRIEHKVSPFLWVHEMIFEACTIRFWFDSVYSFHNSLKWNLLRVVEIYRAENCLTLLTTFFNQICGETPVRLHRCQLHTYSFAADVSSSITSNSKSMNDIEEIPIQELVIKLNTCIRRSKTSWTILDSEVPGWFRLNHPQQIHHLHWRRRAGGSRNTLIIYILWHIKRRYNWPLTH